ncbi:hypothetical protein R1sor_023950 [Riccia sorocarpa]|uniref:Peptidase A2 domain-containing protein n=1 Tax=Riccia sorocarpa TaxID=122646 RepID=A0ABD3GT57_9MARC
MFGKGKEPADSGQVEAPVMPRIQLDSGTLQLLQTLKLVLQQERTEELKDRDATKALRVVVRSLGQFEGKNISKFLRMYKQEMDMIHVPEEKMIQSFTLAMVLEMREHVQGIIDRVGADWNQFAGRMKEEYFLHDSERVTKSSFFEWIERPQKNLSVKEEVLQLAKRELAKRELKNERVLVRRFVPAVPVVQEPVVAQPRPVVQKKDDTSMDELLKGMRDLSLKFSQLEKKKTVGDGRPARQAWVQRCIWCDAPEHARKDCADFQETLRQGVVFWKDGKIALRDTGDFLQTNFGKGGMKKVLEDFQAAHAVATVEAASYGARASDTCEGETFEGYVEPSELWKDTLSSMRAQKTPREVLLRTASTIREATSWNDPVATSSVHAYIAKRKRHLTGESTEVAAHVIDSVVSREEEQEIASVFQLNSGKKEKHLENVEEPVVALIDHGSEINIVSKSLYEKERWPIDIDHNWMVHVANSTLGKLFGACPGVKVKIGDVVVEQNLFVQNATSYPVVLGQPFITAVRMKTKVMDDGSAYAKIRSKDSLLSVQFLTILANHERNKDQLRRKQLPRLSEEFRDFRGYHCRPAGLWWYEQ